MEFGPRSERGILARVANLDVWLHGAVAVTTAASAARYLSRHGLGDRAPVVLTGAALLLGVYCADPRRWAPAAARMRMVWCAALVTVWVVLVMVAPSFSWVAVPLAFVALRVLPFGPAAAVVSAMTLTVVVAWSLMQERVDPTVIAGPVSVAVLAVLAYRALEQDADLRRRLLDELREAQDDLGDAQHTAGVLMERARLSREIHDSVAQGLSSINLLLQAADQHWQSRPAAAREHVRQAALTARDSLDEVRRVVGNLAPTAPSEAVRPGSLPEALRRTCERALAPVDLRVDVRVHGDPVPVGADVATAVLRTARGALANVIEHAGAAAIAVTLTYLPDSVILDVRDDGCGFNPNSAGRIGKRGHGLKGIAERARLHGGTVSVESSPGAGTALALSIPLSAVESSSGGR